MILVCLLQSIVNSVFEGSLSRQYISQIDFNSVPIKADIPTVKRFEIPKKSAMPMRFVVHETGDCLSLLKGFPLK